MLGLIALALLKRTDLDKIASCWGCGNRRAMRKSLDTSCDLVVASMISELRSVLGNVWHLLSRSRRQRQAVASCADLVARRWRDLAAGVMRLLDESQRPSVPR